jgi:hypothetical protein
MKTLFVLGCICAAGFFVGAAKAQDQVVGNPVNGSLPDGTITSAGTQTTNEDPGTVVGNPSDGGLPDGTVNPAGTQTTNVQPVRYDVFPVTLQTRFVTERALAGGRKISVSELPASHLANLALGRAPQTRFGIGQVLALAVGNNVPSSYRLVVVDRVTSAQVALVARAQRDDIAQDATRKFGVLKFTFVAGGGSDFAIRGGSLQLISKSFASRKAVSMLAGGNGYLDFTNGGINRRSVITSVTLQVHANPIGTFTE